MSASKLSLKLLIDQTTNRVVFAEAGKETVDFLLSLLTLPIGTVVKLLTNQGMEGCFGNLYQSAENMNVENLQPNLNKDLFLKSTAQDIPLFSLTSSASKKRKLPTKFYGCNGASYNDNDYNYVNDNDNDYDQFHYYVTENPHTGCPECGSLMNKEMELVGGIKEETTVSGFLKGVKYMVMDDLVVKPICTISSIAMLKKLNVKDVGVLKEKVVDLNIDSGLKLLKAAFWSKEVLTSVFLRKENPSVKE